MTTHSSILAWRIPWTEEPGGLQSMGSKRVRHPSTHALVLAGLGGASIFMGAFFFCESESESEVTQLCLTLLDPTDCSPPGSSVHGILQARVLEWGAIAFSTAWV